VATCPPKLSAFGAQLHAFLGRGIVNAKWWTHGGCWTLASALHKYLGDDRTELWAVGDPIAAVAYHVVVKVGDCYLDAEGASSEKELLARWKKQFPGRYLIVRKLTPDEREHFACDDGPHAEWMEDSLLNGFGAPELMWRSIFS